MTSACHDAEPAETRPVAEMNTGSGERIDFAAPADTDAAACHKAAFSQKNHISSQEHWFAQT
jgi:hypothetical protein